MNKLYVVHSSHPCETVKKALELKGIPYETVELLMPTHAPLMRLRFGKRSVPALRLHSGEKVQGSRAILRRLDELVPEPPLLPAGDAARAAVLDAERWGEEILQRLVRRVVWGALRFEPAAIPSYQEASELPRLPRPAVRLLAPGVVRIARAMHGAHDESVRADLRALPGHIDHIGALAERGVLGGMPPNAADLQIGASVRLLMTLGDIRPVLEDRPAEALALRLFPDFPGHVPAGAFPTGWVR